MKFTQFIVLGLVLVLATGMVSAQNKRIGTASASELLIPIGGKELAKGGAGIASAMGLEAIHWNPAGVGRLGHSAEAMFSNMSYIDDIAVNFGAVGATFGSFGTIALSVKSLSLGDITMTTNDDPDGKGGRIFSPAFVTVGLTYARSLTDAISAGGTIKIISEQIDRVSASGFAVDFGVQYNRLGNVPGLSIGVAVKNVGPQMKYEGSGLLRDALASNGYRPTQKYLSDAASFELPSTVEIGLSYETAVSDMVNLNVNGAFQNNNLYLDAYRLGGEAEVKLDVVNLYARLGTEMVPTDRNEEQENIFGLAWGLGVETSATGVELTLDYTYRAVKYFDANNVISVKLGF